MANSDIYDLVVVGAGQSGIVSARFYLDIHPDAKVGILERDHSVGGVWNQGHCRNCPIRKGTDNK